jgi:hypothetical protein
LEDSRPLSLSDGALFVGADRAEGFVSGGGTGTLGLFGCVEGGLAALRLMEWHLGQCLCYGPAGLDSYHSFCRAGLGDVDEP